MELLKALYGIHSPSGEEKKLKKFIKRYVSENINNVLIEHDNAGNVYFTKGTAETYPCVVAHLDQVQKKHSEDFVTLIDEGLAIGYSPSMKRQEGLGADDKNGLWICLQCLKEFDVIKVAFFVGEEIGCAGSSRCNMDFFKDCRFVVQPDRKGSSDLITSISCGEICSKEFLADITPELFGYKPTSGLMTDVLELSERNVGISCINLSCGYYSPHSDEEFTVIDDLLNCLEFVKHIIRTCTKVYPHTYEDKYTWRGSYGHSWMYDDYHGGRTFSEEVKREADKDDYYYGAEPSFLPSVLDYNDVETYISDLMANNYDMFPEELWPYVSSELETFGVTRDEFIEWGYYYYGYYYDDYESDVQFEDLGNSK